MDRFPDGMHVRLQSRVRGGYLCADEDGFSVSLTTRRGRLNAAWQVHQTQRGDTSYIQLFSAAYGRYLALQPNLSPHGRLHGHRGGEAIQSDYRHPQQLNIGWEVITAKGGSGDVLLRNLLNGCCLRANGRDGRWKTCSCVTVAGEDSTMMHWTVECIPRRQALPLLPALDTHAVKLCRKVMYVQAYDDGTFCRSGWKTMWFQGRSVHKLMLAIREKERITLQITLCVRAGAYGRLTPLVIDLPDSEETLHIILTTRGTQAWRALVYTDVPGLQHPMELLPNGGFIGIESGGHYLLAHEDGLGVSMSKEPMCAQNVWVVQLLKNEDDDIFILLHGAAYGRYLATEPKDNETGTLVQCAYEDPGQDNLLWKVHALEGSFQVQLKSTSSATRFTIRCNIELIPSSSIPPLVMPAEEAPQDKEEYRAGLTVLKDRTIWYTTGENLNPKKPMKMLAFSGECLSDLRSLLSDGNSSVLCTRAGPCGRWTPLFTNLTKSRAALEILVLDSKSTGQCATR